MAEAGIGSYESQMRMLWRDWYDIYMRWGEIQKEREQKAQEMRRNANRR